MQFHKYTPARSEDWVSVTVEPLPGHSDEEVMKFLQEAGALNVEAVGPGFISAEVSGHIREGVEKFAHVHLKGRKQLRR
jgi:hypothetical protein